MPLSIPETSRQALALLNEMSDASANAITKVISVAKQDVSIDALVEQISSKANLEKSKALMIVRALFALFGIRTEISDKPEEVVAEIIQAMEGVSPGAAGDWRPLQRRLERLLRAKTKLSLSAKALDVITENENVYTDARILTDLRPIFLAAPPKRPAANAVIHKLKFEFIHNKERKEIYIALDGEDV